MLETLEKGVKGGKWFSLIDKVHGQQNLASAFAHVRSRAGSAGVDGVTIGMYERHLEANLTGLRAGLQKGTYVPQAVRRVSIPKPGTTQVRHLGVPTVRDRVAQKAVLNVIEPIFEKDFAPQSYGFRPGRGCHDALRRVDDLLKAGYRYVVDADLQSYFDTIDHERLMVEVSKKIADGRVLKLIEGFLKQDVMQDLEHWTPAAGTPQGAVISPLLSNIYLDELDHQMAGLGLEMVRYADDLVILCRTAEEAEQALARLHGWVATASLTLHPTKTKVVDAISEGFEFLGYLFRGGRRSPREKSMTRLKDQIRSKTRRTAGRSLGEIVTDVNRTLRGWFGYFKHSDRRTFGPLDGWLRMRLRSILRKRGGLSGRGRGIDHQRWPNLYFARQGLFSMATAFAGYLKPAQRQTH